MIVVAFVSAMQKAGPHDIVKIYTLLVANSQKYSLNNHLIKDGEKYLQNSSSRTSVVYTFLFIS